MSILYEYKMEIYIKLLKEIDKVLESVSQSNLSGVSKISHTWGMQPAMYSDVLHILERGSSEIHHSSVSWTLLFGENI